MCKYILKCGVGQCGAEQCGAEQCGAEQCGAGQCGRRVSLKYHAKLMARLVYFLFCSSNMLDNITTVQQYVFVFFISL